jgi:hypothetical protein
MKKLIHHLRAAPSALTKFVVGLALAARPPNLCAIRMAFMPPTLLAATLILAGCKPDHRYETVLSPTESGGTGTECLFADGSVAGHVYNIKPAPDGSRIALIAVSDSAALKFRAGTVRVRADGKLVFDTSRCRPDSPPLAIGERIPTETRVENVARTLAGRPEMYWILAAVALLCLLLALCRRVRGALLLVLLAVVLFLCARSLGHAQTPNPPAGQPGILFSRDWLRREQALIQRHINEAEQNSATATRLLDGRQVRDAGEEIVRTICRLDSADLLLQGEPDRIVQLKSSPFAYAKGEEQRRLTAGYDALRQQLQNAQERAATLQRRCITNVQDTSTLQVFLAKRESFRARARAGDNDPATVLEECRRLAAVNKTEVDLASLRRQVDMEVAQLRRARETTSAPIPTAPVTIVVTNEIRTVIEKPVPAPAPPPVTNIHFITNVERILVPITNLVQVTNAPSQAAAVPAPAPAAHSPMPTNTIAATHPASPQAPGPGGIQAGAARDTAPVPAPVSDHPAVPRHGTIKPLVIGPLFLLILLAALVALAIRRRGPLEIELAQVEHNGTTAHTFTIDTGECLVLSSHPDVETIQDSVGACIALNWYGAPVLHPGPSQETLLNCARITSPKKLKLGAEIHVRSQGAEHVFRLRGYSRLQDNIRHEADLVPLNSTENQIQ